MTESFAGLTFVELLDYTSAEHRRWSTWFAAHPSALAVPYGKSPLATVRDVVRHIAFVEHRYAAILDGRAVPGPQGTDEDDAELLFSYMSDGREAFAAAVANAPGDRMVDFLTLTVGPQRASARKIAAHALMHGIRHWAQLATVLREHDMPTDWAHDLLMSSALR